MLKKIILLIFIILISSISFFVYKTNFIKNYNDMSKLKDNVKYNCLLGSESSIVFQTMTKNQIKSKIFSIENQGIWINVSKCHEIIK